MTTEDLSKATAHEVRIAILEVFPARGGGEISPNEMAKAIDESLSNVSYHVRMLERLGVIRLVGTEPRRGALEHYYAMTPSGVIARATARSQSRKLAALNGAA